LLAAALLSAACESTGEPDSFLQPGIDASSVIVGDSGLPPVDASAAFDATPAPVVDAAPQIDTSVAAEAGSAGDAANASDAAGPGDAATANDSASRSDASSSPDATTGPGACGGKTPHGCWPPKAGNPMGCPAQIHEQSEFYPPVEEWEACSSPYYTACIYMRPDNTEANCSCDLGLHWLCTY
jgi:hypothetical protein